MNRSPDFNILPLYLAKQIIEENFGEKICRPSLVRRLAMNDTDFSSRFKKLFGTTAKQYQLQLRVEHAKKLLSLTNEPIREIAERLGYGHAANFTVLFKKRVGIPPVAWRIINKEENI
jgi:AraC-like DNA-binding protein